MKILRFCLVLLFLSAGLTHVNAQEMQAKKIENPHWVSVNFIKFQPGKKDKAQKLIEDYFAKADQNKGLKTKCT